MGKSTYTRKTTNPKMDWSEERKAKWSAQCKEAHANKTWYKQSKKAVGLAISNGKKEAVKFKNRSKAMKKSWRKRQQKAILSHPSATLSENLLDSAVLPEKEKVIIKPKPKAGVPALDIPITSIEKIEAFFDLVEEELGVRPSLQEFINNAIDEKLSKFRGSV